MIRDPLELPFDQYQRYRIVVDLLAIVREGSKPLSILDVGGRTANLRAFLPADRVFLVDVDPSEEPGLVLGDGARLPYRDRSFDVVAAFDTLEHVPPRFREAFVAECARVSKKWVVLAGPYQSPSVDESERLLQRFLRDKLGVEHRYLDEHRHNGLPDLAASAAALEKAGARTSAIGHGNLERWLPLMCLSLYLDHEPELRTLAKSIFRFYNGELYASDHAQPVYRHALIGALGGAPLPTSVPGLAAPRAPAGVLGRFDDVIGELAGFDRARSAWAIERERLWEMARTLEQDLAGHRESLRVERAERAAIGEVARTLEKDLGGHRDSVAQLRDELALTRAHVHRTRADAERMRAELDGELELARAAAASAERARDAEREVRGRLENEVDRMAAEAAALRADLDGHRATLAEERGELAATRKVLESERADLVGHRAALAECRTELALEREAVRATRDLADRTRELLAASEVRLASAQQRVAALERELAARDKELAARDRELAEHRAVGRDLSQDLEGHRGALRDTRAEAASLRGELATALHERNVEQQRLEGAHAELARVARILQDQDRTIMALRTDLRSRAKSLRRALGPKPPLP
ncbi:MAG: methyltransferase domain-containing protein [Planctomycetota bacterium]|nr:methyltransferase domain-containing protein [Planctomycetota bacterium]